MKPTVEPEHAPHSQAVIDRLTDRVMTLETENAKLLARVKAHRAPPISAQGATPLQIECMEVKLVSAMQRIETALQRIEYGRAGS